MITPFNLESYRAQAVAARMPEHILGFVEHAMAEKIAREPASRSHATLLDSIKMPGRPPLGSAIETKQAIQLEFDSEVAGYLTQVGLTFAVGTTKAGGDAGGMRMRVDLLALRFPEQAAQEGLPFAFFIDCKSAKELESTNGIGGIYTRDESTGRWRHLAAEQKVRELWGFGYEVRVELDCNQVLAENIDYVWDFAGRRKATIPSEALATLRSFVAENPGVTMHEAQTTLGLSRDQMLQAVANREIEVRWEVELLRDSHLTHLYANAAIAEFYAATERMKKITQGFNIPPMFMVGERLVIDGAESDIVDLPRPEVVKVRTELGELKAMPRSHLHEQFRQGRLRSIGMPTKEESRRRAFIRKLEPEQIERALVKLGVVESRLLGNVKRARPGEAPLTSTHRLWLAKARRGLEEFGDPLFGLVGWECNRGDRSPRLCEREEQLIDRQLRDTYLSARKSKQEAYTIYKKACEEEKLCPVSYKTFFKRLKKIPEKLQAQLRSGIGAANAAASPSIEAPSLPAVPKFFMHAAHIDESPFDLALIDPRFEKKKHVLGTATLAIMFDTYSRTVLAFVLTFEAPSYVATTLPLIRKCILRWKRLPRWIVTDNGPAFKHEYARAFDDLDAGLTWRPTWRGRSGAQIERFIGITQQDVAQHLPGSTKILSDLHRVPPSHHPENHAALFLASATEILGRFFDVEYDRRKHSALAGQSPRQVREANQALHGSRDHVQIDQNSQFEFLLLPRPGKQKQKIQKHKGVQAFGLYYWSERFEGHQGEMVDVRYDPIDFTRVFVYLDGQWIEADHLPSRNLRVRLTAVQLCVVSMMVRRDRREFRRDEKDRIQSINVILKELHDGVGDPIEMMRIKESAKAAIDHFPRLTIKATSPTTSVNIAPAGLPRRNR